MTKESLEISVNALLAPAQPITANGMHKPSMQHVINELYNANSRGAVLALVTQQAAFVGGDELLTVRSGATVRIPFTAILAPTFDLVEVDTTGSTITLTFGIGIAAYQRRFYGSDPFATPKTIALASDTDANHFTFIFEITDVLATLTFPAGFKSGDTRYNIPSALIWTANEIGIFKVTGDYNGTSWILEFSLLPAV